jgi:hypothetical protein
MIVGGVAGGAIVAVIAILVILLTRGGGGPAYLQQARDALTPVIEANNQLSGAVQSLQPSSSGAAANTAVHSTMAALQGVQSTLSTLKPDSGDQQFAANAQAALSSELAFLTAAGSVLANPSSPSLSQLSSLGDDTKTKLQALDAQVPGVSESFPGASSIVTYAQAQSKAANTKSALRTFSDQVSGLLGQSVASFQQINQVFGQMQTAASGGVANISLAQAEASLASVIANRTALAASARTLSAPTPLATSVRAALTASFDDSLANDQAIQTCLNQANSGDFAVLSQSCLSSTGSGATTSNQAKQHFLSLYNQLRQSIGLPATTPSF